MDAAHFDSLAKTLGVAVTRRRALTGLIGAVLGGVSLTEHRRGAEAKPRKSRNANRKGHKVTTETKPKNCDVGCAGLKAQAKSACKKACRECGGDFDRVCVAFGPVGPTAFTCCLEGTVCDFGVCQPLAICPSGEPAENCALGVFADCGPEGRCALVVDVDGGCSCVERMCSGIGCTTGADCASGLCIDLPGGGLPRCCGDSPFCGTPCGEGGGGVTARGADWR